MLRTANLTVCLGALSLALLVPGAAFPGSGSLDDYERSAGAFADGLALAERGLDDDASSAYEEAIRLDAGFVEAMVNLARVRLQQGETRQARELLDRALRLAPAYPSVHTVRGLEARARGDLNESMRAFSRARSLDPENSEILSNLGAVLLELGFDDDARRVLEEARRIAPDRPEPALALALVFERKGDRARAAFFYGQFLRLVGTRDPDRAAVETRLGQLDPRSVKTGPQVSEIPGESIPTESH